MQTTINRVFRTSFSLVEQQLIEFNQVAMRRPDFKKTEDMFNRVMTRDNIAVVALLEHRTTGARLIVANAHITWAAEFRDVKLVQTAMMMDEIKKIADRFARLPPRLDLTDAPSYSNGSSIPTLVCGDFNSIPESGVYEFLSKGRLSHNHEDFMDHIYGNYTSDGLDHDLHLKSAYSNIGELPFTNYTPGFRDVIDYVWYTTDTLSVTGVLGEVDQAYLSKVVGFPNAVSVPFFALEVCTLTFTAISSTIRQTTSAYWPNLSRKNPSLQNQERARRICYLSTSPCTLVSMPQPQQCNLSSVTQGQVAVFSFGCFALC